VDQGFGPWAKRMSEQHHILVVDDDRRIRELLKSYLQDSNYRVSVAASGEEARRYLQGLAFDLLILDVMMPGESGLALVQALRGERVDVPVLMLSALSDPRDRIAGLSSGSDDYLAKPFEPQELLLRIQSLLRRASPKSSGPKPVKFGACIFDPKLGEFMRSGAAIKLTSRERDILRLLSQKPGEAFSRMQLAQSGTEENERSVDVQINRLRQKIEEDPANPKYLQTLRGAGYALFVDEA
jgi:two-component system, OmpR family, phosphate regulon response regulator OmpR